MGRAEVGRGGAEACGLVESLWGIRGSMRRWCGGMSRSRGLVTRRPVDNEPRATRLRSLLWMRTQPVRRLPRWKRRQRALQSHRSPCCSCSLPLTSAYPWGASNCGRKYRFCRACRLVRGPCLVRAGVLLKKRMKIAQWKYLSYWNWYPLLHLGGRERGTGEVRSYTAMWRPSSSQSPSLTHCGTGPEVPRMGGTINQTYTYGHRPQPTP